MGVQAKLPPSPQHILPGAEGPSTMLSPCLLLTLLPCLLLLPPSPAEAVPAHLRLRREASPLLGSLVSDLTSPFINFFRGASKRPRRPHAPVHHHHAPVQHHRPPVHHHHAPPAPPAPPVHHHQAAPPPQIQVLPAPDLSHEVHQSYQVEPEQPALAPPYEPPAPVYQPVEPPTYEPSEPQTYQAYEPIYYSNPSPPVYEPQTYEPAAVDNENVADVINTKLQPEEVPEEVEPAVQEEVPEVEVEVQEEEEVEVEAAEPLVTVEEAEREPKILPVDAPTFNPFSLSTDPEDTEDIIIDLTQNNDLAEEESDKEPQIISFTTNQIPDVFGPVQKSNEVITFVPVEELEPVMLDQTEDEDINPIVEVVEDIAPVDVVEDVDLVEEEVEEVTPLLADEELRLLVQQVSEDSELLPLDMEVIDINTDGTGEGFALINEDYIDPELEDDLDLDVLIPGLGEDIVEEEATATESVLESVVTTTASSLPETTLNEFEAVPPIIASDPVFREVVKNEEAEEKEQVKRGFRAYDPRQSRVYAHKYSDEYSNWYFFRRGY